MLHLSTSLKVKLFFFPFPVLNTENYKLIGVDLTQLKQLEDVLRQVGVDFSAPSLFVSEVVITYMSHKRYAVQCTH